VVVITGVITTIEYRNLITIFPMIEGFYPLKFGFDQRYKPYTDILKPRPVVELRLQWV